MKLKGLAISTIAALTLALASCGASSTSEGSTSKSTGSSLVSSGTGASSVAASSNNGEGGASGINSQQASKSQPGNAQSSNVNDSFENAEDSIVLNAVGGDQESIYAEFTPVKNADSYNAYYQLNGTSAWTKIDDPLIRLYKDNDDYFYRVDAVGLKAGTYSLKINPVINNAEDTSKGKTANGIIAVAYDRTGFAFSKNSTYKSGSGAYNDDGTLKAGAQVIYVTAANAKTVTATVAGNEVTGIQSILDAKQKKGVTDILDIRIIGCVSLSDLDHISSTEEGIQIKGAAEYQQMDITVEGIGNDATTNGFGFLVRNCGNVEFRNFGLMNFIDDGISINTKNCNIWVHDLDIFYGSTGSDSDQAKGDGSTDLKDHSKYLTISYNHYWDSGKSSLCGMKGESSDDTVSYHHNWFDHSDSRHPRVRSMTVHVYNNYYDGNSKYGVGATYGSSIFVESNYFRNCKDPMLISKQGTDAKGDGTFSGEDGGIIKAYNNTIIGAQSLVYANAGVGTQGATDAANATSFDAYLATTRDEIISSSVVTVQGGTTYNNFDTTFDLGVTADQIQSPEDAKETVIKYAGRLDGGDFKWSFDDATEDTNYSVIKELKTALQNYSNTRLISVQGIATITTPETPATTVTYTDVIELIDAIPATINSSAKDAITAARTAYDGLSDGDKALVTNYKKLTDAETAFAALPQESQVLTFDSGASGDNSFFTVSGNLKSNAPELTYNGVKYTSALKMEGATTITFTTTAKTTIVIVTDTANKKIKIGDAKYTTDANGILSMELAAGTHTISKGDSMNVYAIIIE